MAKDYRGEAKISIRISGAGPVPATEAPRFRESKDDLLFTGSYT